VGGDGGVSAGAPHDGVGAGGDELGALTEYDGYGPAGEAGCGAGAAGCGAGAAGGW
jgi:hypothetical protein